ncbi:MAG: type II secretion system protein GspD, partial [Paracoccaceae bacterium]
PEKKQAATTIAAPSEPRAPGNPAERANQGSSPKTFSPQAQVIKAPGEGDHRLSIAIQGADVREVLQLLSEQGGLNILASSSVQGTVSATLTGVDVSTALNAILRSKGFVWRREGEFIYVGTQADFEAMRRAQDRIGTRLYRPNYAKAADLEALITPILTPTIGIISVTGSSEIGMEEDTTGAGGDTYAGQEAILVRDYEDVLAQVDQIVDQIDQRPSQVAIEAMILSVKLDDSNELGVDFELFRDRGTMRVNSGSALSDLGSLSLKDGGLKVGFLDSSLAVFINALETIGDTNVIATPHLLCLNKHRAQIKIGADLGYVSETLTPQGTIVPQVQFLDVGTQLRLRPFISSDGMVRMEIHPEISEGTVRVENGLTLPDKETTEVTTNIIVPDGHTIVIGGLIREEMTQSATQIPLLGSLPIVGPIFRNNKEGTQRQEILILITPRIVQDPEMSRVGDASAAEFHQRQSVYADKQIVLGRRYVGRKYQRLARDAWAVGNITRALRLVNLAIHFDPLNRATIRLRNDIWESSGMQDEDIAAGAALSAEHMVPWSLDDLDDPQPHHPRDPGRPGDRHTIARPADMP